MQKLQLHLLLLIFAVWGCGTPQTAIENPYLSGKMQLLLPLDRTQEAVVRFGAAQVRLSTAAEAAVRFENPDFAGGMWELQWSAGSIPLSREKRSLHRSLASLIVSDSATAAAERITFLPQGAGIVYSVDGRSVDSLACSIRFRGMDLRTLTLRTHGSRAWSTRLQGGAAAIAVSGSKPRYELAGESAEWTFTTAPAEKRRLVLAFAESEEAAAALAESFVELQDEPCEAQTLAALRERLPFQLQTQDDRAHQIHALLAVTLAGAMPRALPAAREQIESDARLSAAGYLAARARPVIVFPPDPQSVTPRQKQDALRWGSAAHRAALAYGMAGDDTLAQVSLDILSGFSTLQADYIGGDLEVLATPAIRDSLLRLSLAHARLAGVLSLGADVANARGDRNSHGIFQRDAIRASRKAQSYFSAYTRQRKLALESSRREELVEFFDENDSTLALRYDPELLLFPDTLLLLGAGADYGFSWIADEPATFWKSELHPDGFVWQKWVEWRFRDDLKILQTPDFDSLTALLLGGAWSGLPPEETAAPHAHDLSAPAAAFQNLAELYVGIRPGAQTDWVDIEPRLPSGWGKTRARVPYERGVIEVTYVFADDYAEVGMSEIGHELNVFFAYPLASGGFLRTQFQLAPGKRPQRIELKRESDGRYRLNIKDAP